MQHPEGSALYRQHEWQAFGQMFSTSDQTNGREIFEHWFLDQYTHLRLSHTRVLAIALF
jgi:hypothetical protein